MRDPGSPLAVGMSAFPLTAPVFLPLCTPFSQVPFWQVAMTVVVQCQCATGAVWSKMEENAGNLLDDSLLRFFREVAG